MIEALSYVSQATGFVAVVALFFGGRNFPSVKRTWTENSPEEIRYRKRQRCYQVAGFLCATVAVLCQTAITYIGP